MKYVLQRIDNGKYEGDCTFGTAQVWVDKLEEAFEWNDRKDADIQAGYYFESHKINIFVKEILNQDERDTFRHISVIQPLSIGERDTLPSIRLTLPLNDYICSSKNIDINLIEVEKLRWFERIKLPSIKTTFIALTVSIFFHTIICQITGMEPSFFGLGAITGFSLCRIFSKD